MPEDAAQGTLMPNVIFRFIFILLELFAIFVDCIIRQVHAQVVEVTAHRTFVSYSRKPGKSFLVDEAS